MTEGLCDYFVTVGSLDTIGVYGFTGEAFIAALERAGIGLVLDVRQRRGVRGSEYSWANSVRLQERLSDAGIEYRHHKELAPTTELRRLQYRADDAEGVGKRSRTHLAPEYVERYLAEVLDRVDLGELAATLPDDTVSALLCVERDPEACHRSLVADRLAAELGLPVRHLLPDSAE
jgi:uncharacterized protein (DUF488 family)